MEKYCKKCKNYKNFKDYHKHKKGQYGLYPICKDCRKTKEEKVLIDIVSKKECKRCLHIFDISTIFNYSITYPSLYLFFRNTIRIFFI